MMNALVAASECFVEVEAVDGAMLPSLEEVKFSFEVIMEGWSGWEEPEAA